MGLDMYLKKKTYIGGEYEHRRVTGVVDIKIGDHKVPINLNKLSEITESVGYWRKANQIHKWFVDNIQNGKDECEEHHVPNKKLVELRDLCKKAIETKDASLLPPTAGFFFGSTEVDEYYFDDLEQTIKIIDGLDLVDGEHYYRSSW